MHKEPVFFYCAKCGNIVQSIKYDEGHKIICCGQTMAVLSANTVDASKEKHVPVVTVSGSTVTVKVGSMPHPMTDEHYIMWILLQTEKTEQRVALVPHNASEAQFSLLSGDTVICAYAYCNLHGLWKS